MISSIYLCTLTAGYAKT